PSISPFERWTIGNGDAIDGTATIRQRVIDEMTTKAPVSSPASIGPIVAAAHLADGALPALSELEFALTVLNNAYQRWLVRCMAAADVPGLSPVEVLVLHLAAHRGRDKSLAELCMMLN